MSMPLTNRYRMFRRQNGIYFIEDRDTRKQESLRTRQKVEAEKLCHARNEAHLQPNLNLQIARAYLLAANSEINTRTWQQVMVEAVKVKSGETRVRWEMAIKDPGLDSLREISLLGTKAEHFLRVLEQGTVSTNVYLRRIQNFAIDLQWLPCPIVPRNRRPKVRHKERRAITWEEHQRIILREPNSETKAFYEAMWLLGGSQSDIANGCMRK
ncbi:MAG: hypothetical protein JWR19_2107 [Pedosphaera sp.]|nr:hypothetical protein [Pedosphaera sp.]